MMLFFEFGFLLLLTAVNGFSLQHLNDIKHYEFVNPLHLNVNKRNKRDLTTKIENHKHLGETKFQINAYKKNYVIHLRKNSLLLPSAFKLISQNGDGSRNIGNKGEDCFYQGFVEGEAESSVTMSTCHGLKGIIQTEEQDFFIEPFQNNASKHIFYNMKDLKIDETAKCGHEHDAENVKWGKDSYIMDSIKQLKIDGRSRKRRGTDVWKYIETIAVVDNRKHVLWGNSLETSQQKAVELMNYVDTVYKTMNVRIALIGVIVWNLKDEMNVSESAGVTLKNFQDYRFDVVNHEMGIYNDNAQLITGIDFTGSVVGLGSVGVVCSRSSAAVNQDHNSNPAVSANTIAHELGHNLGFFHYGGGCACANPPCVMSSTAPGTQVKGFTDCTIDVFNERANSSKFPCMYDLPDKLYTEKVCGNGYLEEGEECDCGTEEDCKLTGSDKCCDFQTCKLQADAQCATGSCCQDCKFKIQGSMCRSKQQQECDLEEYCKGTTGNCPRNVYISDGKSCKKESGVFVGICYSGLCKTHTEQCETLWGQNGKKARDTCYNTNSRGDGYGNCGKDHEENDVPCKTDDLLCGKIQCDNKPETTLPTWPLLGSNRAIKVIRYTVGSDSFSCKSVKMSFPEELDDPTITFDGTKCNEDSICINHKCVNITTIPYQKKCDPDRCKNGGVCNSAGNCHCASGWACPYCEKPGNGGSIDSGQGCQDVVDEKEGGEDLAYLALLILPIILIAIVALWYFKGDKLKKLCDSSSPKTRRVSVVENINKSNEAKRPHPNDNITVHFQSTNNNTIYNHNNIETVTSSPTIKPVRAPPPPPGKMFPNVK